MALSALSLLHPPTGIDGYPREAFLRDLADEAEADIRGCLEAGADMQLDFTEGRLALKLDPSGRVLNDVLGRFSEQERARIGVHTCPGADQSSTHSADVDHAELLPKLLQLKAGTFSLGDAWPFGTEGRPDGRDSETTSSSRRAFRGVPVSPGDHVLSAHSEPICRHRAHDG